MKIKVKYSDKLDVLKDTVSLEFDPVVDEPVGFVERVLKMLKYFAEESELPVKKKRK